MAERRRRHTRPEHGVYALRDQKPEVGGDTGFASTYRAYDALPSKTAERIDSKPARSAG